MHGLKTPMQIAQVTQTFKCKTDVSDNDWLQKCCMLTKVFKTVMLKENLGNNAVISLFSWNIYIQLLNIKLSAVMPRC